MEWMCHGNEIHMPSKTGGAFHLCIPDPQQITNLECHHISQTSVRNPRTEAPGAGTLSVIRYPLSPRQPGFASRPCADFRQLRLCTSKQPPSFPGFSQDSFHTGLACGAVRSRRCGGTEDVNGIWIVIGSQVVFPEPREHRA